MQLTTRVFPAPFGPIRASSSPALAAREMRSSTRRPPNRKFSELTSSSAIPPPTAAILLDGPIAPTVATRRLPEIEFLDVAVGAQSLSIAIEHNAAIFEHIAIVRDAQGDGGTLFHDDNGDTEFTTYLCKPPDQFFHHDGGETER